MFYLSFSVSFLRFCYSVYKDTKLLRSDDFSIRIEEVSHKLFEGLSI